MSERPESPVVRSATLWFELDPQGGVFHLVAADTGERVASNLECAVQLKDGLVRSAGSVVVWRPLPSGGPRGIEVEFGLEQDIRMVLKAHSDEIAGGVVLSLIVHNQGAARAPEDVRVLWTGDRGSLDICPDLQAASVFSSGWQSWEPAGTTFPSAGAGVDSFHVGGIANRERGDGLVLGFTTADRHFGRISVSSCGGRTVLTAGADTAGALFDRGHCFEADPLWLSYGLHPAVLLLDYTRYRSPARHPERHPVVWDSWHVQYENSAEADILEGLDSFRERFPRAEVCLVGDGYQKIHMDGPGVGDWLETNPRFPHGLEWLAAQIRKRGLKPGIWIAPFLVGEKSQFYKYYPDGVVRSRQPDQQDWWEMWRGDRVHYLDTTNGDGRNFLRDLFEQLSYRWGFEYFQVDFAYAAAVDGFRSDPTATPADAYGAALRLIRETIGDKRYLLMSGAPVGAAAGADSIRITPDAAPLWNGPCGAGAVIHNLLTRSFVAGGYPAASSSPLLTSGLTDDEFRSVATASGLVGGPLTIGGKLNDLSPTRASILNALLPAYSHAAVAVDLFDREKPRIFALPVHGHAGHWWIVGLFNCMNEPQEMSLSFGSLGAPSARFHVYDFWSEKYLGLRQGSIGFDEIAPHSCKLLAVHPDLARPQVISCSDSIFQGAMSLHKETWTPAEGGKPGRLVIDLVQDIAERMEIRLVTPDGMFARTLHAHGARARLNRERSRAKLLVIETSFREHCSLEVIF